MREAAMQKIKKREVIIVLLKVSPPHPCPSPPPKKWGERVLHIRVVSLFYFNCIGEGPLITINYARLRRAATRRNNLSVIISVYRTTIKECGYL